MRFRVAPRVVRWPSFPLSIVCAHRMPFLQLDDARFPLGEGETRVGWGSSAGLKLPSPAGDGTPRTTLALVSVSSEGAATLRLGSRAGQLFLNGVPVGGEPAPLLHGDRLSIQGCELRFADDALSGDTGEYPVAEGDAVPDAAASAAAVDARSRGRLVSLVDGREYTVGPLGLTLGRAASCDVVVTAHHVSRHHARVEPEPGANAGYALVDASAHGVLVNGGRVRGRVALARGDTIRIGSEEFRFYADATADSLPSSLADVPSLQTTAARPSIKRPVAAPPAANARGQAKSGPALAVLEVINEGPSKGVRAELVAPLSHLGRGEHNDVVVADESVSDSHAKIQRRDDAWWVVDMESTNGTYVNGERVYGEAQLPHGADVRFGGIKMSFRVVGSSTQPSSGTRVIVGIRGPDPKRAEQRMKEIARGIESPEAPVVRRGRSGLLWFALAALAAITAYLVLQGR